MAIVERHVAFVEALREAGLAVSLAEDIDAAHALTRVSWTDREVIRSVYAATLLKRHALRPTFDAIFDLYFPRMVGDGAGRPDAEEDGDQHVRDSGADLAAFRDELVAALAEAAAGDDTRLQALAAEAVGRFGAMPGRGPGLSSWSSYTALQRVDPSGLIARVLQALGAESGDPEGAAELGRGRAARALATFQRLTEEDARRRIAEEKGAEHVARTTLRPNIEVLDFTAARKDEVAEMRRRIYPLARRLATRLAKEHHANRRGPLDFRRTVRASMSTGGVPITTVQRPKRPHRTELVVLCDVSGSVANFASFTLLLVYALREQFQKVRAFTFVDTIHEVTDAFVPGADPADVMADLAASIQHAALWGRTNYGRAFATFREQHPDALGPKTSLLILGDGRSNYSDLGLDDFRALVDAVRHVWWLNPEHERNWGTGDSAALTYGEYAPMAECRNLSQLSDFVGQLAR